MKEIKEHLKTIELLLKEMVNEMKSNREFSERITKENELKSKEMEGEFKGLVQGMLLHHNPTSDIEIKRR